MRLKSAEQILWSNDIMAGVLARIPDNLKEQISFATDVGTLAPAVCRFLVAIAGLGVVLTESAAYHRGRNAESNDLILMDEPFAIPSTYQQVVLDLMDEALRGGATIVCAGAPPALESCFRSVIQLRDRAVSPQERLKSRHLDRRFSRRSEVLVRTQDAAY
jgi:hypothetical protein